MKKLLSLLSVLTISGTAVPTTIAASPYKNEKKLNININYLQTKNLKRSKRNSNCPINDKYDPFGLNNSYYITLRPELVEEILGNFSVNKIKKILFNSDFENFKNFDYQVQHIIAEAIANYLSQVTNNERWKNSNKKSAVRLAFDKSRLPNSKYFSLKYREYSESDSTATKILFNEGFCPNKYFDKLKIDFPDWNKEEINLGIINYDNTDGNIKKSLKEKYPNLIIENIEIVEKKDYNPFENYNQSFKIKTRGIPERYPLTYPIEKINYSIYKLKPKFIFTTKKFLEKDLPNLFKENGSDLLENWKKNINDWNKEINRQKEQDFRNLSAAEKRIWKGDKINDIKDKIHDFIQNLEIIDLKIKTKHLYETTKEIKNNIEKLNSKINEIDNQLRTNKKAELLSSISGLAAFAAGLTGWIPVIGVPLACLTTMGSGITAVLSVNV